MSEAVMDRPAAENLSLDDFSPPPPPSPTSLAETGLSLGFVCDLLLKMLFTQGTMLGIELSRKACLPFRLLEEAILFLKEEKCVEINGGDLIGTASYRFAMTDFGRQRARDAMEINAYIGPAPVPLNVYIKQANLQKVTGIPMTPSRLKAAFGNLVITDELIDTIGPAVVSGKAVFLYGPPGTGKTSIARAVGSYLNDYGGHIYVPHAVMAEEGVITMYDPIVHDPIDEDDEEGPSDRAMVRRLLNEDVADARWVKIHRPVIITGGELALDMLDLRPSGSANVYQAPTHIKANGGIFLIDDFGRQMCSPEELLNRWILPLEDRHDFLCLKSGKKFMVPFEQLIIFSTNLDPKDLVDDAFLRRIRHKIGIYAPPRHVYETIFNMYVKKLGMNECPEAIEFLYKTYYDTGRRINRPSDCRDLLEIVVSVCRFQNEEVRLDVPLIEEAARQFIGEF